MTGGIQPRIVHETRQQPGANQGGNRAGTRLSTSGNHDIKIHAAES